MKVVIRLAEFDASSCDCAIGCHSSHDWQGAWGWSNINPIALNEVIRTDTEGVVRGFCNKNAGGRLMR